MTRPNLACAFVLLGVAGAARAQGLEEFAGAASLRFEHSLGLALGQARAFPNGFYGPFGPGWQRPATIPGKDDFTRYLQEHSQVVSVDRLAAPTAPAAQIDLDRLLNRQWKSPATFAMGGQTVYIGGAFDRQQNAFVSAFVDGWAQPKFFDIKGLLDKEGSLTVGSVAYGVTLSANVLHPMKSQIVFENRADEDDQSRISVKKLLESLNAAGDNVALSDQSYKAFYYNDVKDGPNGPSIDADSRTFAMILTEGDEMHVFLIPAEAVPSNQVAVFKMHKDKLVGLQVSGTTLKVFENP